MASEDYGLSVDIPLYYRFLCDNEGPLVLTLSFFLPVALFFFSHRLVPLLDRLFCLYAQSHKPLWFFVDINNFILSYLILTHIGAFITVIYKTKL